MKVILLKDVPGTGRRSEIKEVAAGHAQNYLIRRGLATLATAEAVKRLEKVKAEAIGEAKIQKDLLKKNMESLEGKAVTITAKANDEGHLFAGIHKEEISNHIKEALGLDMPKENIELDKPIKMLGEFPISGKVGDSTFSFKLIVEKASE